MTPCYIFEAYTDIGRRLREIDYKSIAISQCWGRYFLSYLLLVTFPKVTRYTVTYYLNKKVISNILSY